jgi:hydrogenase nickel incorporation protein HypA/HybF
MEETLNLALEYANKQGATQIKQLKMRIGEMSGVVPEALKFAFEVVTAGTMAANSQLEIETIPVSCWCSHCEQEFQPPDLDYCCPNCQQVSFDIIKGKEIELTSLEVS